MMRLDPRETEDNDGTACEGCGDLADGALRLVGRAFEVPLCKDCRDHLVIECSGCHRQMWQSEGTNLYSNAGRYCLACVPKTIRDERKQSKERE